jgi:cyclic beta-1,2-glucan synthetase
MFGIEYLLGIKFRGDTVFIKPCTPEGWKEFEVEYRYFDTLYKIKVIFNGENSTIFDNTTSSGNSFKLVKDGGIHFVEVRI